MAHFNTLVSFGTIQQSEAKQHKILKFWTSVLFSICYALHCHQCNKPSRAVTALKRNKYSQPFCNNMKPHCFL